MKTFKDKNGKIITNSVDINGIRYFNVNEDFLIKHGFEEVIQEKEKIEDIDSHNEFIKNTRKRLYEEKSDYLFIAYQKYLALENHEKAEKYKEMWLYEVNQIDLEHPYISEE